MDRYSKRKTSRSGCVYLIRVGEQYKIGLSGEPLVRFIEISKDVSPMPCHLLSVIRVDNMAAAEGVFHDKYQYCRGNGEWFYLSNDQVIELMMMRGLDAATSP